MAGYATTQGIDAYLPRGHVSPQKVKNQGHCTMKRYRMVCNSTRKSGTVFVVDRFVARDTCKTHEDSVIFRLIIGHRSRSHVAPTWWLVENCRSIETPTSLYMSTVNVCMSWACRVERIKQKIYKSKGVAVCETSHSARLDLKQNRYTVEKFSLNSRNTSFLPDTPAAGTHWTIWSGVNWDEYLFSFLAQLAELIV